jgi:tRNA A37 threonylcarbamoyladenosine biosynthesis protein TsaE
VDLYRLRAPVSFEREGLETVVSDLTTVLCVEWAERLPTPLEGLSLEVRIEFLGQEARRVTLRTPGSVAARLLSGLG